jgi:hypothetical protein
VFPVGHEIESFLARGCVVDWKIMTRGDDYRRYAAECLALAQRRKNADDKTRLLEMAALWLRMAESVEKHDDKDVPPKD